MATDLKVLWYSDIDYFFLLSNSTGFICQHLLMVFYKTQSIMDQVESHCCKLIY